MKRAPWKWLLPASLLLLASLALIVLLLAPRMTAFSPAGEGPWSAYTPLRWTFSQPMPPAITETLHIRPSVAGVWEWESSRVLTFTPSEPWPVGEVSVSLPEGVPSRLGVPSLRPWQAAFRVAAPRLVYLWPHDGPADLYALDVSGGEDQRLTELGGVLDFALLPRHPALVLSVSNEQGGADIMRLDRVNGEVTPLVTCGPAVCRSPAVAPDGTLAYLRLQGEAQQLWLLPPQGEPQRVEESEVAWAAWSPSGWLVWYDAAAQGYRFRAPDGATYGLPSQTGEAGAWLSPGDDFIYPELLNASGRLVSHLMRYHPGRAQAVDLSQETLVEDFDPAPAPAGDWVAFTRKYLDETRWTPGRQLWRMRPDGSDAQALTDRPLMHHRMLAWSPDGKRIAFVRVNQANLSAPPEIWMLDLSTGEEIRLVIGGLFPQWMP